MMVLLADNRLVSSSSPEWMAECEAYAILAMDVGRKRTHLQRLGERRGLAAEARVRSVMATVEPAYVLSLPDREARHAYLNRLEREVGGNARANLEPRIRALWESRKQPKGSAA